MKYLITLSLALTFGCSALQCQNSENASEEISLDNPEYVEWVSQHGFRFVAEFKDGETTLDASEILDSEGNAIPQEVVASTFDITKYDFDTVVAPEKNTMIKVSDNKAIFIYSKARQAVLFERYLINKNAKQ